MRMSSRIAKYHGLLVGLGMVWSLGALVFKTPETFTLHFFIPVLAFLWLAAGATLIVISWKLPSLRESRPLTVIGTYACALGAHYAWGAFLGMLSLGVGMLVVAPLATVWFAPLIATGFIIVGDMSGNMDLRARAMPGVVVLVVVPLVIGAAPMLLDGIDLPDSDSKNITSESGVSSQHAVVRQPVRDTSVSLGRGMAQYRRDAKAAEGLITVTGIASSGISESDFRARMANNNKVWAGRGDAYASSLLMALNARVELEVSIHFVDGTQETSPLPPLLRGWYTVDVDHVAPKARSVERIGIMHDGREIYTAEIR